MHLLNTPKADEGASLSRRAFISAASVGAITPFPALADDHRLLQLGDTFDGSSHPTGKRSLGQVIADYRAGLAAFNRRARRGGKLDGFDEVTYLPHFDTLSEWQNAAGNLTEAIAALEVVLEELGDDGISPVPAPLVASVLAFLKAAHSRIPKEVV